MHYREYTPRPELQHIVRCYWHLADDAASGAPERVVPDGCAEIILNRADPFQRAEDNGWRTQAPDVLLVGQIPRAITIASTGQVDLLGIRFEPAGLFALLGVPMDELVDADTCLRQVHPQLHARLREACLAADPRRRIELAERALLAVGAKRREVVTDAAHRLSHETTTVFDLARSMRIGRRTLERRFRREVGLSPRHFARITRLQRVIQDIELAPPKDGWAGLAAGAGYYDQSHLIRDFRLIAGTTPQSYVAEQPVLACALATGLSHPSNPSIKTALL